MKWHKFQLAGLLALCAVPSGVWAQAEDSDSATPDGFDKVTFATVERIMDTAVQNIARRYALNPAQTQNTSELMRREVRQFLKDHEAQIWPAIRSLLESGFGKNLPEDIDEVKRLGEVARPLAKEAKEAIFRANAEWREILTEEQKKVHDFDLEQMDKTFEHVDSFLGSWQEGKPIQGGGLFPQPKAAIGGPPRPPKPVIGTTRPIVDTIDVGILTTFVEEFIKDYKLTEGQITTARSILEEFKEKAEAFKSFNKQDFAKIVADRNKARAARDADGIKKATTAHKKLLEPFYELFAQMEDRLRSQLTTTQLDVYKQKNQPKRASAKTERKKKSVEKVDEAEKPDKAPAETEEPQTEEQDDDG